jgi:hypothetical protein
MNVPKVLWGAKAIGKAINKKPRQAHYLLKRGLIRAARQVGSQWCADEPGLLEQFCPQREGASAGQQRSAEAEPASHP